VVQGWSCNISENRVFYVILYFAILTRLCIVPMLYDKRVSPNFVCILVYLYSLHQPLLYISSMCAWCFCIWVVYPQCWHLTYKFLLTLFCTFPAYITRFCTFPALKPDVFVIGSCIFDLFRLHLDGLIIVGFFSVCRFGNYTIRIVII